MGIPEYRNVTTYVRPQRVVTFINKNDKYWMHTATRIIECYSMLWGGANNIIVPTDGETIDEKFWIILEKYDPDYLFLYHSKPLDLKIADPEKYKAEPNGLNKQRNELNLETSISNQFGLSDSLQDKLKRTTFSFLFQ